MICRMKSMFYNVNTISALKIAQILFLVIPGFVCGYIFFFTAGRSIDIVLNDPIITVHFLTVLTYPFCYLICKNSQEKFNMDKNDDVFKVKILLLTISQMISLNIICAGLIVYSLFKKYGKYALRINFKSISMNKDLADIVGVILIILVVSFSLFVKLKLNII